MKEEIHDTPLDWLDLLNSIIRHKIVHYPSVTRSYMRLDLLEVHPVIPDIQT